VQLIPMRKPDLQHTMFTELFGNQLALAPIDTIPIHNVLDIATGTGVWATEFGKCLLVAFLQYRLYS
jgi:hypothetical protein